ncbi:hypothetical protein EIP91_005232 [Steccherinum ochraceum]|uniref:AB hydrolase-1 domain-containing protein n=1 Tax=Steccherinum ochraceum TaxID=92696 RepID=A0A4R0R7F1_9APHY|nr:hypothetical protein EIP91_005232 [Steccherinum ochraceum]
MSRLATGNKTVRYLPSPTPPLEDDEGVTLLLAHANGLHKETWGALVGYLFDAMGKSEGVTVREAWSIECPNHGESAVLNEAAIERVHKGEWNGWEWPRAIHTFLRSKPAGVDFFAPSVKRKIVGIGHSQGGNAIVFLSTLSPRLPVHSYILLDPTISIHMPARDRMVRIMTALTYPKRDCFLSRDDAFQYLRAQPGTRNWHADVLKALSGIWIQVIEWSDI